MNTINGKSCFRVFWVVLTFSKQRSRVVEGKSAQQEGSKTHIQELLGVATIYIDKSKLTILA